MGVSAATKRYETHNKLLALWQKLFPNRPCNEVELTGVDGYCLWDSLYYYQISYNKGRVEATKGKTVVLKIDTNLLPFNL